MSLSPFLGHDAADRVSVQRLANGARASFTYDDASQITRLANIKSDGTTISSFDYRYDAVGNRDRLIESSGVRVTWTYDNTYQLTREQRGGANSYDTTYVYDATGNRTLKIDGGVRTTSAYNAANEVRYLHDSSGRTTFTFDTNGNQAVELAPSGGRTTNTWDYENKLTLVKLASGVRNTMAYDPEGLRVKKEETCGTSKMLWDEQNVLLETNASDVTQVIYTLEPVVYGNLISQRRSGTTKWHHFDAQGSSSHLTDSLQAATDSYIYKAFGELLAASGTSTNSFRYVGQLGYQYDGDSAQLNVRARVFLARLARWLSRDSLPFHERPGNPLLYAQNNPVNSVDPSGLQSRPEKLCQGAQLAFSVLCKAVVDALPCGMMSASLSVTVNDVVFTGGWCANPGNPIEKWTAVKLRDSILKITGCFMYCHAEDYECSPGKKCCIVGRLAWVGKHDTPLPYSIDVPVFGRCDFDVIVRVVASLLLFVGTCIDQDCPCPPPSDFEVIPPGFPPLKWPL